MTQQALVLGLPSTNIISSPNDQSTNNMTSRIQDWCGRGISAVGTGVSVAGNGLLFAIQKVFSSVNLLTSDAPALAGVFRKLDQHVLRFFEHLGDSKGKLGQFSKFLGRNVAFIDFFQLVGDVNYFAAGRFKEKRNELGEIEKPRDKNIVIAGKLGFFAADFGGALLWLQEMSFISLSKAAVAIGEVRVFSFVPKAISSIPLLRDVSGLQRVANAVGEFRAFSFVKNLSCLSLTLRALDLAYALFAVEAGQRLLNAENKNQAISAGLDLSSYLAELTLNAIVFAGVTNVIGLGIVGVTCITFAVASFLYRVTHEKEIRQKPQLLAQAVAV